jgi:hypothetical protein
MTDAQRWGVEPGYHDVAARWWEAPPSTIAAFLEAMGADGDVPRPGPAIIAAPGRHHPDLPPGELWLEDGTSVRSPMTCRLATTASWPTPAPPTGPRSS